MTWHSVLSADAIAPGTVEVVELEGMRVAICRTDSAVYAVEDVCSHDGGALDQGTLLGEKIECPRHGAMFDITSGKALTLPAVRPIKSFAARMNDGSIEVEIA